MAWQKFSQPCHHIANSVPNYSFVIPLSLVSLYTFPAQNLYIRKDFYIFAQNL